MKSGHKYLMHTYRQAAWLVYAQRSECAERTDSQIFFSYVFNHIIQIFLSKYNESDKIDSIINNSKNFGLAGATIYGSCKRRKQKFVMSFTITVYHSIKKKTINEFTNVNIDQ